jgi:flagellar protein FlgJ
MFRPDFPSSSFISNGSAPSVAAPSGPAGGGFSALFNEVRGEVLDFIEHGSSRMDGPQATTASFSTEGHFYQTQLGQKAAVGNAQAGIGDLGDPMQQAFITSILPYAEEAGQQLGVSPHILAAQAALESGWGQRPLRGPDGADTHNLFGVKASGRWQGEAVNALTTEYTNGSAQHVTDRFRSFPDHASAFRDFVRLLRDNPRYQMALNTGSDVRAYAQGLVRGGYATDPAYAEKLAKVAARIQSVE